MPTSGELFAAYTKTHRLEIVQDDGLHRHLRFRAHDEHGHPRSVAWFDLITVPGTLTFVGDFDAVVFRRLDDMFEFFRTGSGMGEPDFDYWAEKVVSGGRRSVQAWSEESFVQLVKETVAEDIRSGVAPRGIGRAVRTQILGSWYDLAYEQEAREALESFDYEGYRIDAWEWRCMDYTHDFRWACHAIVWGIAQYDLAKTPAAVA